jgi:glucose/arabinose dehydrogenase
VYLTAPAGDRRLYVVEQAGRVMVVEGGAVRPEPFLDIRDAVGAGGERGLLSLAFSPTYADDGLVYVDYTDVQGDSRIVEFKRGAGDRIDPGSRRELLKVDQPFPNHNGGLLVFDSAGMLLIGFGDGGSGGDPDNRSQDLGDLLGKILRIDPRPSGGKPYGIPADNPFVGRSGARPEIWAFGLRNPWRFAFDAQGVLYVADVGQGSAEEINATPYANTRGANYGWSVFEGDQPFKERALLTRGAPLIEPALVYGHDAGRCTVIGGAVYAGTVAQLRGRYLYADYCSGEVFSAAVEGAKLTDARKVFGTGSVSSFGVDSAGEMYVLTLDGPVYRITV